jgi:tRNA threonylcarbamoyl adenosine modification protein YjeE
MHHDPRQQVYAGITLEGLDVVAEAISKFASTYRVWLFKGEMGAGKTTLIKAVGAALGVTETMSSPTFSIVNQYEAGASGSIYHFDFYRIRSGQRRMTLVRMNIFIPAVRVLSNGLRKFLP